MTMSSGAFVTKPVSSLQKTNAGWIIVASHKDNKRELAMSENFFDAGPTKTFWIVGAAALAWNLFGVAMYISTVTATPESYAAQGFNQQQIEFLETTTSWSIGAFAIAVTVGALAALFLLFRKGWAVPAFVVSFVALLSLDIYNFVLRDTIGMFGMGAAYMQAMIFIIAILEIIYARHARQKGWLT